MKSIYISSAAGVERMVATRNGRAEQIVHRRDGDAPEPGDIYLARVVRVAPGVNAAFVDLGNGRQGFLNREDVPVALAPERGASIQATLKPGAALAVQVKQAERGDKLAIVSADIALAGFFSVIAPLSRGVFFSRNFKGDRSEYERKLTALNQECGVESGWIVRAEGPGASWEATAQEARFLAERWLALAASLTGGSCRRVDRRDPALSLTLQHWREDLRHIYFDDEARSRAFLETLARHNPRLAPIVTLHQGDSALFDVYNLESEIQKASASRLWLKSGGYLDFHDLEAMTVVDVNSGKNLKSRHGDSSAMRTNLESVEALAQQLRARDIGGLVVVDFINGERGWAKRVDQAMARAVIGDPMKVDLLPVDRFGLMRLTRQRAGGGLNQTLREPCAVCGGTGWIKKLETVAFEAQRQVARQAPGMEGETFIVACGWELEAYLRDRRDQWFAELERLWGVTVAVRKAQDKGRRQFTIELG